MTEPTRQVGRSEHSALRSLRNAARPGFLPVMTRKALVRVRERSWRNSPDALAWARSRAEPVDAWARGIDPALWDEALRFGADLDQRGRDLLTPLGIDLGGGGHYPLLHFLVRLLRPAVAVETGVAAGYSSRAVLTAMAANNSGRLYSSDFPFFRLADPERYIGILVEDDLRDRWSLRTRGDRVNLPEILEEVDGLDLFHYDSDKPVDGRRFAMELVRPRLRPGAVVLMDDIQDNTFFRDYADSQRLRSRVFEFDGKFVGAIGLPE